MEPRLLPYTPQRDVYRLLGVEPSAGTDEIVAACRRLSRTFHPDRNRSPRAHLEMQVVNAVRDVLTDPAARMEYDMARLRWHAAASISAPEPVRQRWPTPGPRSPTPAAASPGPRRTMPRLRLPDRSSPVTRYSRAVAIGAWAMLTGLVPERCPRCRMTIGTDRFCPGCGAPRQA